MHEPCLPPGGAGPQHARRWRHDLCNEVNALTMAASAARHMLEMGDQHAAMANLHRADDAGRRCIDILRHMPPSA